MTTDVISFHLRESSDPLQRFRSTIARLRRHRSLFMAGLLASFFCLSAGAEPSAAKLDAARQVVKTLDLKPMHDLIQAECVKEGDKSSATELFEEDPAPFSGLSPKSAYWPEVEGVFRRQMLRVCQAFSPEQYAEALAQELAGRIPPKGLPRGADQDTVNQALRTILLEAGTAAMESAQQSMDAMFETYTPMMADELTAIIERYQREPK